MGQVLRFPEGFLWGAATSAHQVEGRQDNDWSEWERSGKVRDGSVSGLACDQWNRYSADFDLARGLGHNAHRLSVEWSRIEPEEGTWDEQAIQHYREVIAALRSRGLEPLVTLWHFTNPRWFMKRGGWEAGTAPTLFARYAAKVAAALPDVNFWITVNEPNVYSLLSYLWGQWPPEVRSLRRSYRVYRNLAIGHCQAYRLMHQARSNFQVGFAQNFVEYVPSRPKNILDRTAAAVIDDWSNHRWIRWVRGCYEFLGVNHYLRQTVRFGSLRQPVLILPQGLPQSDFGWQIVPESMYAVLTSTRRYNRPVIITENGLADSADRFRPSFIRDYLAQVHRAIQDGSKVVGYLHWSLLDNFEWREGFSKRFGLIAVDFSTQQRVIRPSARSFADICRSNELLVD